MRSVSQIQMTYTHRAVWKDWAAGFPKYVHVRSDPTPRRLVSLSEVGSLQLGALSDQRLRPSGRRFKAEDYVSPEARLPLQPI
jgi:hypothetical protein